MWAIVIWCCTRAMPNVCETLCPKRLVITRSQWVSNKISNTRTVLYSEMKRAVLADSLERNNSLHILNGCKWMVESRSIIEAMHHLYTALYSLSQIHTWHTLKRKCCNFYEIFITGCTGSWQNGERQCRQSCKFRHNNIFVSVQRCYFKLL